MARRRRRRLLGAIAGAVAVGLVAATLLRPTEAAPPRLLSEGVAVTTSGPKAVPAGDLAALLPGSRSLAQARGAASIAQQQRAWLATAPAPASGEFGALAQSSLLDLHALTLPNGAVLGGPVSKWRYVWPRDASFAAAAYAAVGRGRDATSVLSFLQRVQGADGRFEARYLPDGRPVDDGRAPQLDGSGWALWGLDRLIAASTPAEASDRLTQLRPLLDRATSAILGAQRADGLPVPSSDYWEHAERRVTLGTAAPLLAGLQAAQRLYARLGVARPDLDVAERRLGAAIALRFGPTYGRYPGSDQLDAAIAFLQPPFVTSSPAGADAAVSRAWLALQRPAGGLAPGAGWRDDGISWTPETALFGLVAAEAGRTEEARDVLRWLWRHRTGLDALPEKVDAAGRPASVAPLAWTDALVLLTLSRAAD